MPASGFQSRPLRSVEELAEVLEQQQILARARRRQREDESWDDLEEALNAPWTHGPKRGKDSYGRPAPLPERSTVTVRKQAVAAMSRKRPAPDSAAREQMRALRDFNGEGFAPTVRPPDPVELAAEEERSKPPPGVVRLKKPAGWRFFNDTFWVKGDAFLKCQFCGKESARFARTVEEQHSPFCPLRGPNVGVRGPALPPRLPSTEAAAQMMGLPMGHAVPPSIAALLDEGRVIPASALSAVEKHPPPEKSPAWTEWCRRGECLNCGAPPRSTISHEGGGAPVTPETPRRGVRQKVRDTLGTSLCWEPCHRVYTATDCLPDPSAPPVNGRPVLRTRAESLALIHGAQATRLLAALARLPLGWHNEALSIGLARIPEDVLARAILGEPSGTPEDLRLDEALEETSNPI